MTLCLGLLLGGGSQGRRLFQEPPMSFVLNSESAAINTTAKETFLPFTVGCSTDLGLLHGFCR